MYLTLLQVGDTVMGDDCSSVCSCTEAQGQLTCEDYKCPSNEVCGVRQGEVMCVCEAPFVMEGGKCTGGGLLVIHGPIITIL